MQEEDEHFYDADEREKIKCSYCELRDERWKIKEHEEELCSQKEVLCINSIYGKVERFYCIFERILSSEFVEKPVFF